MIEYSGLDVHGALELPCDMYMLFYKNWYIDRLMQTQEGREYLDDCKRLRMTKMDRRALSRLWRTMGGGKDGKS